MVTFNALFKSVLLAVLYTSFADAVPYPGSSKHATHRRTHFKRDLKLEAYHPPTTYQTFADGIDASSFNRASLSASASSFVASQLKVDESAVYYRSGSTGVGEAASVAYVQQQHDGIPFANAVANVALKNNKVVAFGHSFVDTANIAASTPTISVEDAIAKAEAALDGKFNGSKAKLEYVAKQDGSVALTHVVQIQNEQAETWFEAFVDAHSGDLLSVTDFVTEAAYTVLPITKETLPEGQETLTDPADLAASPLGWHATSTTNTTTTEGNNVVAYKGTQTNVTSQSSDGLVFDYPYDVSLAPTGGLNIDAARTNAFYIINTIHDLTYRYGFTEENFNFQNDNFGKGGSGNDRVLMSVQDSSGTNNANFATPPDGQSGQCRMYVWTLTTIRRDGSLENDIPVHEMTHGVSNRLTGGGTGRCLQTTEAGGMGEGWSDALAEWTEHKSAEITDYVLGAYVTNDTAGIRNFPYSTNTTTNPLRYSDIAKLNEVHNIGEIWANLLHNVYAALVAEHGWSETAFTNPDGTEGNIVFLHLFIDGFKLQPCNPTFVTARDAFIQADTNRYAGANKCLLWKVFASRGLGTKAANHVDDSTVPDDCT